MVHLPTVFLILPKFCTRKFLDIVSTFKVVSTDAFCASVVFAEAFVQRKGQHFFSFC